LISAPDDVVLDSTLFVSNASLYFMAGFGGSVDQNAVLEFIDAGHDMILAADSSASDLIRSIATECGVDFDEASNSCGLAYSYLNIFVDLSKPTVCVLMISGSRGNGY